MFYTKLGDCTCWTSQMPHDCSRILITINPLLLKVEIPGSDIIKFTILQRSAEKCVDGSNFTSWSEDRDTVCECISISSRHEPCGETSLLHFFIYILFSLYCSNIVSVTKRLFCQWAFYCFRPKPFPLMCSGDAVTEPEYGEMMTLMLYSDAIHLHCHVEWKRPLMKSSWNWWILINLLIIFSINRLTVLSIECQTMVNESQFPNPACDIKSNLTNTQKPRISNLLSHKASNPDNWGGTRD